ncbi:MAG: hypothetical protein KBD64_05600 [Gammaproteobacteria bacterium]|nr:hypothetical protein [Gammaproteobacteria bacterium]
MNNCLTIYCDWLSLYFWFNLNKNTNTKNNKNMRNYNLIKLLALIVFTLPYSWGWAYINFGSCQKGFKMDSGKCVEVKIPENGELDITGNGWWCIKGFRKESNQCIKINIPANAELTLGGNDWQCIKGFKKELDKCSEVIIPQNGILDYKGSDWICVKGFKKESNQCIKINIPAHAELTLGGNDWICTPEYKKVNDTCIKMSTEELLSAKESARQLALKAYIRGKCDVEYKTNAEVCIKVTDTDIDCSEDFSNNYYKSCDVHINYRLETDYQGGSYITTSFECDVDIQYEGRNTYISRSDNSTDRGSHDLYSNDTKTNTMDFSFSFSPLDEVIKAKISAAECKIKDLTLG